MTEPPSTDSNSADKKDAKVKFGPPPVDGPSSGEVKHESGETLRPGQSGLDDGKPMSTKKIGHRRVDKETGDVTYKKVRTSDLMGAIQLGISNSIGSLASAPERDLLLQDFDFIEKTNFPKEGSTTTPAHDYGDFRFKTYAPIAFRYFRELFSIKPEDFLASMTEPMRELSNPGASGSVFYVSSDDQFIIKTVQHKEAEFLQKLLPGYYMNLQQNSRTLLPKFFGLYCYQSLGKNVRLLAMNNLLPSSVHLHQKFDLKGSTYKRRASAKEKSKPSPTLKDLDWVEMNPEGLYLEASTYEALIKTINRDCLVLEAFKIMDYSLLIGIHNIDLHLRDEGRSDDEEGAQSSSDKASKPDPAQRKVQRNKSLFSTWDSIQPESLPMDLGENYPVGGVPARNAKGDRLLIFLGVIDILQSYRLFKKIEHTWKSVLHDGDTVSVHRPGFYAARFQDFLKDKVVQKIPSLDMPDATRGGSGKKFRNLVASFMALKHSPSRRNRTRRGTSGSMEAERPSTKVTDGSATARPDVGVTPIRPSGSVRQHPPVGTSPQGSLGLGGVSAVPQGPLPPLPPHAFARQETLSDPPAIPYSEEKPRVERLFAPESSTRTARLSSSSDTGDNNGLTHKGGPEVTHL